MTRPARSRPGAKGKGPSLNDERCAHTRTPVKGLAVDACERCGEDLTDTACLGLERRTLIDLVFEKGVRHVDAELKCCPRCRTQTRARFPAELPGPLQLRMSKVKQKVSGCFRTRRYAEAYCRISSYLQSMANQGYNPLVAIQIALAGRAIDNMSE